MDMVNSHKDLEGFIFDLAETAAVAAILIEHHGDQARAIAKRIPDGKTLLDNLKHSQEPLNFIVMQMCGLANKLRDQFFEEIASAKGG
jgi:hypothetical protein